MSDVNDKLAEQEEELTSKIAARSIWVASMFTMVSFNFLSLMFIIGFGSAFKQMLVETGVALPAVSMIVIGLSDFMGRSLVGILFSGVIFFGSAIALYKGRNLPTFAILLAPLSSAIIFVVVLIGFYLPLQSILEEQQADNSASNKPAITAPAQPAGSNSPKTSGSNSGAEPKSSPAPTETSKDSQNQNR